MSIHSETKKVTTETFRQYKKEGKKIACITAYDFTFAQIFDKANMDMVLIGDSASNVIQGNETTLPITLDEMIYHAKCVTKACNHCLVVVDLPFGSYQSDSQKALESAIRIMKESNAHAVKLEGGKEVEDSIKRIIAAGIPVMGHLGLTPQSIYQFGTYKVRAKEKTEANQILANARLLEKLGCFGMVLEKIPFMLAKKISEGISIPTIGIGAGQFCDGQILVMHDMLGISKDFQPRFVRRYLELNDTISNAVQQYIQDVKQGEFPSSEEQY